MNPIPDRPIAERIAWLFELARRHGEAEHGAAEQGEAELAAGVPQLDEQADLISGGEGGGGDAALELGDASATALGVRVDRTRVVLVIAAVALACVATATTGPIAFVAFLAGPIASRIVGPATSLVLPAALTGACLVLAADLLGQFAFDTKFPVGVITGILGAPYLLYLLIRTSRCGGSS